MREQPTAPSAFTCLFCGHHDHAVVFTQCRDYYLGMPDRVDYVRCAQCRLVQQHPIPADISAFYKVYPVHQKKSGLMNFARRLMNAAPYFKPSRGQSLRLLDFGCGDGNYLDMIAAPPIERIGYEPDAAHAARLSERLGVPVLADLEDLLTRYRGTCDVVTAHFVIEHLTDPDAAFAAIAQLLKPGGLFYMSVPHFDSWESRLFGVRWHGLDPPRHISFAAPAHVEHWGRKHGLTLRRYAPVSFPNGIAGSLPPVLLGRFHPALFMASMIVAIPLSRLFPQGCCRYELVRDTATAAQTL